MQIGFITDWPLNRPGLRSGVPFQIAKAMREAGHEVVEILIPANRGKLYEKIISKIKQIYFNKLLKNKRGLFDTNYDKFKSKATGTIIHKELKKNNFDCLFSIKVSDFAYLKNTIPKCLWIDNTFETFINTPYIPIIYNPLYEQVIRTEAKSMHNCSTIFTASAWLKKHLVTNCNIAENKIKTIERGATFKGFNSRENFNNFYQTKTIEICHVLFINTHWMRKGGDKVIETCKALNHMKFPYKLHIIGTKPPEEFLNDKNLNISYYGRLYPHIEKEGIKMRELFENAHFLFIPTLADGFGIVYAEAASFGLPSIATDIMGIESSVINGVTGQRFPIDTLPDDYAKYIIRLFNNKEEYKRISISAFEYSREHFDWNKNVNKLLDLVKLEIK